VLFVRTSASTVGEEDSVSAPTVEDRAGRRRAPAPATGNRLPAPVRERRPALAALAVLLIVGGALASGLVALRSGNRSDYVVFVRTVEAGQQIRSADLGVTRLAGDSNTTGIAAARRGRLVGEYATTRVYSKTLANFAMFSATPSVPAGTAVVGAVLAPAQRPASQPRFGDVVAIYDVPKSDSGATASRLVEAAQITDVGAASGTDGLPVSLRVPADSAASVATAASQGELTIVELPLGTALSTAPAGASAPAGPGATGTGTGTSTGGTPSAGGSAGTVPRGSG
jgi:hypothetical protein